MKIIKKTNLVIVTIFLALIVTACTADGNGAGEGITVDRSGSPIELPQEINHVVAIGPSNTEILIALGFADYIVGADDFSVGIPGLPEGIPLFSMMAPDGEQLINLEPDLVFVSGSGPGEDERFQPLIEVGITVVSIPASSSIDEIKEDIRFIAAVMGATENGDQIIADMEAEINQIREIGATITEPLRVYFEIGAPPYMFSFGTGVFLNEMIEVIGAENIFAEEEGWISVTDEVILELNPDVILTNVFYLDDPVADVMGRPGWSEIAAVQNGRVHFIDADSSSRPTHNIIRALQEMARAIYPDRY